MNRDELKNEHHRLISFKQFDSEGKAADSLFGPSQTHLSQLFGGYSNSYINYRDVAQEENWPALCQETLMIATCARYLMSLVEYQKSDKPMRNQKRESAEDTKLLMDHVTDIALDANALCSMANSIHGLYEMEHQGRADVTANIDELRQKFLYIKKEMNSSIGTFLAHNAAYAREANSDRRFHDLTFARYMEHAMHKLKVYSLCLDKPQTTQTGPDDEIVVTKGNAAPAPRPQIEAASVALNPNISRKSAVEIAELLKEKKPDVYEWMIKNSWEAPRKLTQYGNNHQLHTPIHETRELLESLMQETYELSHTAKTLLAQPALVVEQTDQAHADWKKQMERIRKRHGLHAVGSAAEDMMPAEPQLIDVYNNPALRPYMELKDTYVSPTGSVPAGNHFAKVENCAGNLSTKVKQLTHPASSGRTSAGRVTDHAHIGRGYETIDTSTTEEIIKEANGFISEMLGATNRSIIALDKYCMITPATTSQLGPISKQTSEFVLKEIYPRIEQNALHIQKAITTLEALYKEQEGQKKRGDDVLVGSFRAKREAQLGRDIPEADRNNFRRE